MGTMKSIKRAMHAALERGHCLHISVIPPITNAGEEETDMGSIKDANEAINAEAADAATMDELKGKLHQVHMIEANENGMFDIPDGAVTVQFFPVVEGAMYAAFTIPPMDPQDNGKAEPDFIETANVLQPAFAEEGEKMIRAESTARMAPPVFQMGQHVCLARVSDDSLRRAAEQRRDVTANPPAQRGRIIDMSSSIDGRPAEYLVRHLTPEGELIEKWYSEDALINDRF